jgi:hypothetical protein
MTSSLLATVSSTFVHVSTDMVTVLFFWVGAFFLTLILGRGRAISWVIALMTMAGLYAALYKAPWFESVIKAGMLVQCAVFVALSWLAATVFGRVIHGEYSHQHIRKIIQLIVLSVAFAGITICYAFHFFGLGDIYKPSALAATLFVSSQALFTWLVAGCIAVFVASKR